MGRVKEFSATTCTIHKVSNNWWQLSLFTRLKTAKALPVKLFPARLRICRLLMVLQSSGRLPADELIPSLVRRPLCRMCILRELSSSVRRLSIQHLKKFSVTRMLPQVLSTAKKGRCYETAIIVSMQPSIVFMPRKNLMYSRGMHARRNM